MWTGIFFFNFSTYIFIVYDIGTSDIENHSISHLDGCSITGQLEHSEVIYTCAKGEGNENFVQHD